LGLEGSKSLAALPLYQLCKRVTYTKEGVGVSCSLFCFNQIKCMTKIYDLLPEMQDTSGEGEALEYLRGLLEQRDFHKAVGFLLLTVLREKASGNVLPLAQEHIREDLFSRSRAILERFLREDEGSTLGCMKFTFTINGKELFASENNFFRLRLALGYFFQLCNNKKAVYAIKFTFRRLGDGVHSVSVRSVNADTTSAVRTKLTLSSCESHSVWHRKSSGGFATVIRDHLPDGVTRAAARFPGTRRVSGSPPQATILTTIVDYKDGIATKLTQSYNFVGGKRLGYVTYEGGVLSVEAQAPTLDGSRSVLTNCGGTVTGYTEDGGRFDDVRYQGVFNVSTYDLSILSYSSQLYAGEEEVLSAAGKLDSDGVTYVECLSLLVILKNSNKLFSSSFRSVVALRSALHPFHCIVNSGCYGWVHYYYTPCQEEVRTLSVHPLISPQSLSSLYETGDTIGVANDIIEGVNNPRTQSIGANVSTQGYSRPTFRPLTTRCRFGYASTRTAERNVKFMEKQLLPDLVTSYLIQPMKCLDLLSARRMLQMETVDYETVSF
jgi:hypothetical protein